MNVNRLTLVFLAAAGCPSAQPCTDCPSVEGVWALQYLAPDFACDGGALPAPAPTVQLTRQGSVLRGAIDGVEMTGTLYDTYDFQLTGLAVGGGLSVQLRATYVGGAADGGERLVSGRLARTTSSCVDERRFTGGRF